MDSSVEICGGIKQDQEEKVDSIEKADLSFNILFEKKIRVCKNNLILNCILSSLILLVTILPYILPWSHQLSSIMTAEATYKFIYISLFSLKVP